MRRIQSNLLAASEIHLPRETMNLNPFGARKENKLVHIESRSEEQAVRMSPHGGLGKYCQRL